MKIFPKLLLLSLLSSATFCEAFAQQAEKKVSPFRFLIRGGLEYGGDDVAEVYFVDGSTQSVKAGQGAYAGIGAEYQVPTLKKLLFQATAGYKFVTTKADNANISLSRVPIQFTANWMATKKLRFGAGLVSHQGIRFKADGIGEDITFQSALGPTVELAYSVIGLTYTALTYKDQDNNEYSANAIGVSITFALPKKR